MESQTTATAIDDFEEQLVQMNIAGSTQEELIIWHD